VLVSALIGIKLASDVEMGDPCGCSGNNEAGEIMTTVTSIYRHYRLDDTNA